MKKIIFHIDMNSYFASVEQQANPFLRGKPIVVGGKEGSRSVIVAASIEAKKFGIKTAMPTFEAKKLCPNLIFLEPDGSKYMQTTKMFLKIFNQFSDKVEVFSIDEAFLDMTGWCKNWQSARDKANKIKFEIKQQIGERITCSIGIATNKLLAKLASDMQKPNGLVVINEKNKIQVLDSIKLDDFCGIGRRILQRLENIGVESVKKLRQYPVEKLVREFGPFYGQKLKDMSNGHDDSVVISAAQEAEVKSISRAYTLPYDTFDKQEILQVLLHLCEKCGRELRHKKLAGRTLQFFWRFSDFTHSGFRVTLDSYINDSLELYKRGLEILSRYRLPSAVRLIGIRVSNLAPNSRQIPLFQADRQRFELVPYLDQINDRYGELTVKPAHLLKLSRLRKKIGGFRQGSDDFS